MHPSPHIHAQAIRAFGGPEQLESVELPIAPPAPGQVQLQVAAAAVNPVDLTTRAGQNIPEADARFPMVLGWDVAGTIVAIDDGVTGWAIGDRVAAMSFQPSDQNGTYAERINLAAGLLAAVPDGLALEQAATIPLAGLTAGQLLGKADPQPGETLLVNGPLGAVGRLVVQLAAARGISVVAVAKPDKHEAAISLGATAVVDRGENATQVRALHPDGVDAAIDLVGGAAAHAALAAVRDGGRYVTSVPSYIDATGPFEPVRDVHPEVLTVEPDAVQLAGLLDAAGREELSTAIDTTYPLSRASDAHRRQAEGGLTGKLVLLP